MDQLIKHDPREQDMKQYCTDPLKAIMVSTWYITKASEVVQVTSLPDVGLELLNLGLERGVSVHWELKLIAGFVLQKLESFVAGLLEILQEPFKFLEI